MRALICHACTPDLSGVKVDTTPKPTPGDTQACIRVHHASINYPDLLMCQGLYQHKPMTPFTPGMEVSGHIELLGSAVDRYRPGDAVVATMRTGGIAEFALAEATDIRPKPKALSFAEAAAYSVTYSAAYVSLVRRARLVAGETLLVHGAGGGVGLASVALGRIFKARIIATSASPSKFASIYAQGAEHVLLSTDRFAPQVKDLTDGRGADVIVDPVGGRVFDESTHCIAFDGRILVLGFTSGSFANVATNIALIKGFSVMGVRAGEYARRFPDRAKADKQTLWEMADCGRIRPRLHSSLPLEHAARGLSMLRRREATGKVVIDCA